MRIDLDENLPYAVVFNIYNVSMLPTPMHRNPEAGGSQRHNMKPPMYNDPLGAGWGALSPIRHQGPGVSAN